MDGDPTELALTMLKSEDPVCFGRSHPTTAGAFKCNDAVLTLPRSHRSHLLRSHRARIFDQCLRFFLAAVGQLGLRAGTPQLGVAAGSRPPATPFAAESHSIDGRSMLPPPAATQSPFPTHGRH